MNVLELFAGAGGGIYGGLLLGHTTVCAVEIVDKNRELLLQRQRDGVFPRFPVWDDVRTFDGHPWRGVVDVVSGGFPCTDISSAGKGAGIDGEQSGLWREMARIVREVRPRFVFVENSPMLITRGLGRLLGDLAALGYDCRWTCLSAADCGAPHKRDRIWILGSNSESIGCRQGRPRGASALRQDWIAERNSDATRKRRGEAREHRRDEPEERPGGVCSEVANANSDRLEGWTGKDGEPCPGEVRKSRPETRGGRADDSDAECDGLERVCKGRTKARTTYRPCHGRDPGGWPAEPGVGRVAPRMANWKHRIFALGNGQVPRVHAAAWLLLACE